MSELTSPGKPFSISKYEVLEAYRQVKANKGVLSVLVYPLIAVGLHQSAPLTPADVGITTADAAARTDTPPDNPSQPAQPGRPEP